MTAAARRWLAFFAACLFLALQAVPALAVRPDEMLADPRQEERAREISAGLRCLVCQNQSIDDSDADLARDLRVLVRERISEGDTNEEVIDFVVSRYGEFVLLKPRFTAQTVLLWGAPLLVLLFGGALVIMSMRNRRRPAPAGLSAEEDAELKKILNDGD
ncbi:MAG: cytochrome c-type biogenesis protein CcmH [Phyllobacteriaceae bacterium]|nr:cytochrome c-type biogenesis protein CcmH [Phyllobacteriaceae bacterium]MBA89290.1 cytochrome c-type biogenesis protein CcmH [Phyllobacteriaceae bacterium]